MRILHIVTMVSTDGAFGGPSQVAIAQSAALRAVGESVILVSSGGGYSEGRHVVGGADVRLFGRMKVLPGSGFAGTSSPRLLAWLLRNVRKFDLVHLHLARDLVMIPSAFIVWMSRRPYVIQAHGMIEPTRKPLGVIIDLLATRRIIRGAQVRLALGEREQGSLRAVAKRPVSSVILPNGLAPTSEKDIAEPEGRQVLFLARLHKRKRPAEFARMAIILAPLHPDVMFYLVGPDEGETAIVSHLVHSVGLEHRIVIQPPVAPDRVRRRMSQALVYVLPARDEPFGLTILEALSVGTPVVLSKSGGLARVVEEAGAGIAIDDSVESMADAVSQLLDSVERRAEMGARGRQLVGDRFSIDRIRDELLTAYQIPHSSLHPSRAAS